MFQLLRNRTLRTNRSGAPALAACSLAFGALLSVFLFAVVALSTAPAAASPLSAPSTSPLAQTQTDVEHLSGMSGAEFEQHFLSMMIEHHQGAVEMAGLVEARTAHQELKTVARNIIADQQRETADMTNWLKQWYNMAPMSGMMHGDMHGMSMSLENLRGDEFDKAFLQMMHEHHRGAIAMSELVPTRATHSELKTLAQNIITSQEAEIQQFMQWAKTWYNLDLMAPASAAGGGVVSQDPMGDMGDMGDMGGMQPGMPRTGAPNATESGMLFLTLLASALLIVGLVVARRTRSARRI
ncbi:MAG TPA: DUF305 domain-containing protein [Chloroflexia bacterium]